MATKQDLQGWIIDALKAHGGSGSVVDVSRAVWEAHEEELKRSGSLFFTWQYDLRWAAKVLRDAGRLAPAGKSRGPWRLTPEG